MASSIERQRPRLGAAFAIAFVMAPAPQLARPGDLAAETGGHAERYVDAVTTPATDQPCTVQVGFVLAGTLQSVTGGFQLAIDTQVDLDHPAAYKIGLSEDGHSHFSGGGLHEVTADFKNGVLTLPNPPKFFDVEAAFGPGHAASALIQRHCFGAQTRLVYVLDNPQTGVEGGDWLWDRGER